MQRIGRTSDNSPERLLLIIAPGYRAWADGTSVRTARPLADPPSHATHVTRHWSGTVRTDHGAAAGSGAGTEGPSPAEASSSPTAMPRRFETYTAATMIPMATTATSARTQGFASAP